MQLKSIIDEVSGLRFMVDQLDIQSSIGRRMLLSTELLTSGSAILNLHAELKRMVETMSDASKEATTLKLQSKLAQLRDIKGTIRNIEHGVSLDDIQLFEVKHFSIISEEIRQICERELIGTAEPLPLDNVIAMLDPEGNKVPSFYVYDSYSTELAAIRKRIKSTCDDLLLPELYDTAYAIEDSIRAKLSHELCSYVNALSTSLERLGKLDILIAKAQLAIRHRLVCPTISNGETRYEGLFNPQVKTILAENGNQFQPVDIDISNGITLISGANMAGKTVLLKTLALSQYLCQLGFFVPARQATITVVNKVLTSIGDDQSELKGLSAYAAEILKIDQIVTAAKSDKHILILIDELARTTNPTEGKAIVTATANLLNELKIKGIITTHYSGIATSCRRLRVKGFAKEVTESVTLHNITDFIDYSLIDDTTGVAPQEALRIAALLGVDGDLLNRAKDELQKGC